MASNYNAKDITHLDYFDHIRQYPGMYIGSKDANGLQHLVKEIVANSVDEYLNGACNRIDIKLLPNNGISIVDNGRGIPHGEFQPGISVLQACFGIENTGGKFNNATGESGYNTSGGEHGTGGKAVNALSTKLIVSSTRDGETETIEFNRGKFVKRNTQKAPKDEHGQSVTFYPDGEVLETVSFDYDRIKEMIREESFLSSGLTFSLTNEKGETEFFCSEHGLEDFIDFLANGKSLIIPPIFFHESEGTFDVEVGIGYLQNYSNSVKLFTNNIPQEKGTHLTGFKTAFTLAFNQFARDKKWLKDKDENLTGADLAEGQILVINFKMIDPVFKGQNKEELSSSEGRTYVQKFTKIGLENYFLSHEKDIKVLFEKAAAARKAREAAKKAKDKAREVNDKKGKKQLLNLPSKLVDCWGKDRLGCELYIAEGDSAASGLVEARDSETVAVFPIRGKMINAFKNNETKVFENQEVVNIIKALGLDLDPKTKKLIYDKNKLRYGKIVAAADADPDGKAIKNLLFTNLWWLCPELFINGHVFAAQPPLFRITKGTTYTYLKDEKELEAYKAKHRGEKYLINRNKGLGEQDSHELGESILNRDTRNIVQITVDDVKAANNIFDILMGPAVPPRREYLLKHSEEAQEVD